MLNIYFEMHSTRNNASKLSAALNLFMGFSPKLCALCPLSSSLTDSYDIKAQVWHLLDAELWRRYASITRLDKKLPTLKNRYYLA